jgi:acyl-coenzyme A thioesterase PaaI-like protein
MDAVTEIAAPSGLEQIRSLVDGSSKWRGIAHLMGFKPIIAEEGFVVFEGSPTRDVYNPIGSVHGGYAATLLATRRSS